uniref:Uncharacterized protein n=1 Tax=Oryza glaberrima TaxID=4538 RepID=I1QV27_ORYGL
MSSSGRGGKRQGAPPPAPFGAAAKRAQPHGGHLADDSIRASGDLSSPIGSAPNGRCLLFRRCFSGTSNLCMLLLCSMKWLNQLYIICQLAATLCSSKGAS